MDPLFEEINSHLITFERCYRQATGLTARAGIRHNTDQAKDTLEAYEMGNISREDAAKKIGRHLLSAYVTGCRSRNSFKHMSLQEQNDFSKRLTEITTGKF